MHIRHLYMGTYIHTYIHIYIHTYRNDSECKDLVNALADNGEAASTKLLANHVVVFDRNHLYIHTYIQYYIH